MVGFETEFECANIADAPDGDRSARDEVKGGEGYSDQLRGEVMERRSKKKPRESGCSAADYLYVLDLLWLGEVSLR
jgi:hypothetical protein